ncbi:MAG: hypothetical protein P8Y40_01255 [Desulfobacterales bacterium]
MLLRQVLDPLVRPFSANTGAGGMPAMIRQLIKEYALLVKVIEMREFYVFCNP